MSDHTSTQERVHDTLDPDSLYSLCLGQIQVSLHLRPALSSLSVEQLLGSLMVAYAHAIETGMRVLSTLHPYKSDRIELVKEVGQLLIRPERDDIYYLWHAWRGQHPDWSDAKTLSMPRCFMIFLMDIVDYGSELGLRARRLKLPVFKAWAGLSAGPMQPDEVRLKRLLNSMDRVLQHTVSRRLDITRDHGLEESPELHKDKESEAIAGAVAKKNRIKAMMLWAYREGVVHPTDSGRSIAKIQIPPLPIFGMECADGIDAEWRARAHDLALKMLAEIAPGYQGLLETTLPDAAYAAQRDARDKAGAKKRGGSGGKKAEKAGTEVPAVQHFSIGNSNECSEDSDFVVGIDLEALTDPCAINPETGAEVARLIQEGENRFGIKGVKLLQAILQGLTIRQAASQAKISGRTAHNYLRELTNWANPS